MNRLPSNHPEQGASQAAAATTTTTTSYCDMNYQLIHQFHRMDQPQHHHHHQNHHHQQQQQQHHQQQQLPMDTIRRGAIQTEGYGQQQQQQQHHNQNYHHSCNNQHGRGGGITISSGGGNSRHIYGQYPQQVSEANQQHHHHHQQQQQQQQHQQQHQQQQQQPQQLHMYVQQQLESEPSTGVLYHIPTGHHNHENMPYASAPPTGQTSYGSNILHARNHMHQEPMQTTSQLYNNPTIPLTRVAPRMHHHPNQQQQQHHHHHHHEQYHYNDGMVMMQHQHHFPSHNHQMHRPIQPEDNYLVPMHQMPEHLHSGDLQQQQQQLPGVMGVVDEVDQYGGDEIIDQNQVFYQLQQEQMDSLPTIKQQQQLQQQQYQLQQQQQQQQQQLHLRQNMNVSTSPLPVSMGSSMATISMDTYGSKLVGGQIQSQQQQQPDTTVANLMVSSPTPKQHPQPPTQQTTQIVSRSMKPDLAIPAGSPDNSFDSQQQQQQRRLSTTQQHQGASPATSYLNSTNQLQHHPQQRVTSSISSHESDPVARSQSCGVSTSGATRRGHQADDFVDMRSAAGSAAFSQDWLDTICRHLIDHMNRFGICVIDNFLGSLKGETILKEVQQLYNSGQYSRGMLVNSKLNTRPPSSSIAASGAGAGGGNDEIGGATAAIRNDRVIWIDGFEDGCSEINNLIQTLCAVITNSSRLSLYSNNGLDKIVINKRTKAHVACYPGSGTRYIKHVDNPNGDGRVITSIYYLNKDWNTKRDGGLLRMFPVGMNEVANIEPLFDRVLFFWSDRRNPHEVLPAYRDRFAITVWYIGANRQT